LINQKVLHQLMLNFKGLNQLPKDLVKEIENIFMEEGEPTDEQNMIFIEQNLEKIKLLNDDSVLQIIVSLQEKFSSFKSNFINFHCFSIDVKQIINKHQNEQEEVVKSLFVMLDDTSKDLEFTLYQFIKYVNIFIMDKDHLNQIVRKLNFRFEGIEFMRTETRFNKTLCWCFKEEFVRHTDGRLVKDISYFFKD